jgi:DNA primase
VDKQTQNIVPERIKKYLNLRGISDLVINNSYIGWDGYQIIIPIFDQDSNLLFNKYRRDPENNDGPKYSYDTGSKVAIYGIELLPFCHDVIICEGEFDALVLRSHGFNAVTSTGGSLSFQEEWIPLFEGKEVYVCFDNDDAGRNGAIKICNLMRDAKVITLPARVGDHGDITDYFTKCNGTVEQFKNLIKIAEPIMFPEEKPIEKPKRKKYSQKMQSLEEAKKVPLDEFLTFKKDFATCPFHVDKTPSLHRFGPETEKWKCHSCGERGDVIDLVMKINAVSLGEAITIILK